MATSDPESAASARLSRQVQALASTKERAASNSRRGTPGSPGLAASLPYPQQQQHMSDGPTGGQQNARLPPLMHGYASGAQGSLSASHAQHSSATELLMQPVPQQSGSVLPGPTPASHPWQPKRKPPSAFMRNSPLKQQLEQQQHQRAGSAGPGHSPALGRSQQHPYPFPQHNDADPQQQQHLAEQVLAAATAAMAADGQAQGGGQPAASALPPWGVSSVSDLEALDSILDHLVVVDARMRKALLRGPLISFETVVPDHALPGASGRLPQPRPEDDPDRTFLTAVKGVVEDGAEEPGAELPPAAQPEPPPPEQEQEPEPASPQPLVSDTGTRITWAEGGDEAPRDSAMFPNSIPNTGMHPSLARAYLTNKLAPKAQLAPPPAPATAEHLLRTRPPPFIAAPSYDALCSQIRDVQKQYTCGSTKPPAPGAAGAAAAGGAGAASSTSNQYISGLDGPSLDEVVAHQDLPISLVSSARGMSEGCCVGTRPID